MTQFLPASRRRSRPRFAAITLTWLTFYSWGIERIGAVLQRPKIRPTLDAVMGTILVALGLRLAVEQR